MQHMQDTQQGTPSENTDWLIRTMNRMVRCRDRDALLDVAYDALRDGLGYDRVGLLLVNPTGTMLVEHRGTDEHGCAVRPDQDTPLAREKAAYRARLLADPRLQDDGPGYIYARDMFRPFPRRLRHLLDGQPPQTILVALRTACTALGLISVDNLVTRRPIEERAAGALVAFAHSLATAIENVTLLEERTQRIESLDSALRRRVAELEWLRDVSRRVNAARSLDQTLDVVYDAIREGLGYDRVGIQLFDRHTGWWQELRGADAQGRKTRPTDRVVLGKDDVRWQSPDIVALLDGADYYYSADVYAATPPPLRHMLDGEPTQNLNVPLRSGDDLIGIISVDNLVTGRSISPDEVGPLLALVSHVGTAVHKAHLQDRERAERMRLHALLETARLLNSTLDADHIMQRVAAHLARVLDAASVSFSRVDTAARRLVAVANHGPSAHPAPGSGAEARSALDDDPAVERALTTRRPLHACVDDPACPPDEAAFLRRHDLGARLIVPVIVQGEAGGILAVHWAHPVRGHPDTQSLCLAVADQAALALRNAHLYAEAERRADHDPLTGLLHHRAFLDRLDAALAAPNPLALVLLDVDNFKLFNDVYGHPTGDAVLQSVATILRNTCRDGDIAGRYGGDEFAVMLSNVTAREAHAIVERMARTMRACPFRTANGEAILLSASVGMAFYPVQGTTRAALLAAADADMYAAKRGQKRDGHGADGAATSAAAERPYEGLADVMGEAPAGALAGLIDAVDAKDRYTRAHSDDVTRLALRLADALGLGADERRTLALAAALHDVGKIVLPDRVLRKPGPLSSDELAMVQRHIDYSVSIIRGVLPDEAVLSAVATHHERWDGRGYPAQRPGSHTPLLGRILQIADAVSAMQLDQPYRRGMAGADIVAELRAGAGAQFDPGLVELCIDALAAHGLGAALSAS